jgi:hypothetical protein
VSAVFAYGGPPFPGAGEREIPDFIPLPGIPPLPTAANPGWDPTVVVLGTFGPCPKCKRHCRENECPFCYADGLKPEGLASKLAEVTKELSDLRAAVRDAGFHLGTDAAGKPGLWCNECQRDTGFHYAKCSKHDDNRERDALKRKLDAITDLVVNGVKP